MELPQIGQHCSQEGCNQLDFLPLECSHCHQLFCTEHHNTFQHSCQFVPDKVLTAEEIEELKKDKWQVKCGYKDCKTKELVEIKCVKCGGHFCLNHRHSDQHECIKEESTAPAAPTTTAPAIQVAQQIKDQITTKLEEAKTAGGSKGAMANKLALMRLKGRAKGDPAIPQSERVFFTVQCPNPQQNPKPLDLWLGKLWTMGKTIDYLARSARIKNRNNVVGQRKLHVFKATGTDKDCLSLPFDITIGELIDEGRLVDGDALIFDYLD